MTEADPNLLRELDEYLVHGRHPAGGVIAAEVPDVLHGEICVWDLETGELVWRPKAHSISWSADGDAVALLTGRDGDDFELRSWPERDLISSCAVNPWACCNTYVALSPRGDRAGVLWWHQGEGGVNLVALEGETARHLEDAGYMTRETNVIQGRPSALTAGSSRFPKVSSGGGCLRTPRTQKSSALLVEPSAVAA